MTTVDDAVALRPKLIEAVMREVTLLREQAFIRTVTFALHVAGNSKEHAEEITLEPTLLGVREVRQEMQDKSLDEDEVGDEDILLQRRYVCECEVQAIEGLFYLPFSPFHQSAIATCNATLTLTAMIPLVPMNLPYDPMEDPYPPQESPTVEDYLLDGELTLTFPDSVMGKIVDNRPPHRG